MLLDEFKKQKNALNRFSPASKVSRKEDFLTPLSFLLYSSSIGQCEMFVLAHSRVSGEALLSLGFCTFAERVSNPAAAECPTLPDVIQDSERELPEREFN